MLHVDPGAPARAALSCSISRCRRSRRRGHRVRQATSGSRVNCCRNSGAATCISARTCWFPKGFDSHPQAHYPLMVFHGHFPDDISEFRTDAARSRTSSRTIRTRFHLAGYNRIEQQEAYAFYQKWISADFPRFLVIEIEHANPYYDDSYAVNSANLGPVRRCHQQGADSGDRKALPRHGRRAGRASPMAARPAAGRRSPPRSSTPTCTTAPSWPARIRSIFAPIP